jgi:glycosyltransferase involved in cell wall biosynthesis
MEALQMPELKWSLDALTIKDNILFGFGWAFHPDSAIETAYIQLSFSPHDQRTCERIGIDGLKPRTDVAAAYPEHAHALLSGFVFLGAVAAERQVSSIELVCKMTNGQTCTTLLPLPSTQSSDAGKGLLLTKWRQLSRFKSYLKRVISLVRTGQWTSLWEKTRRHLKAKPQGQLKHPSDIARHLDSPQSSPITVIIDHDLGGGANHYRQRYVDAWVDNGGTALVFTHHIASLTSLVIIKSPQGEKRLAVPDAGFFLNAVSKLPVAEVVYNTAVSLANPHAIAPMLMGIQQACRAKLIVLVHDFYQVCPSHFLINHIGQFCNIPDVRECATCLQRNSHGFVSLFPQRDIVKWRAIWGALLMAADEIVAFSNNSSQLLRKAYPHLAPSRISVRPHSVEHLPGHIPRISQHNRLHIGVVGQIGFHKGAHVVADLAAEIKQQGIDAKMTVFGTIEERCDKDVLTQTGTYKHHELPYLIEQSDANIFLFPSIWPETFSFVVQELMDMQLPVAAFNFGAPAERLAVYDRALILDSMEPKALLASLLAFHQKIYFTN